MHNHCLTLFVPKSRWKGKWISKRKAIRNVFREERNRCRTVGSIQAFWRRGGGVQLRRKQSPRTQKCETCENILSCTYMPTCPSSLFLEQRLFDVRFGSSFGALAVGDPQDKQESRT